MIDRYHELRGAGINTGTIPSKTLREMALALSGLRSRDLYGVDLSLRREVTVRDFLGHERHVKVVFNANFLGRLCRIRRSHYSRPNAHPAQPDSTQSGVPRPEVLFS